MTGVTFRLEGVQRAQRALIGAGIDATRALATARRQARNSAQSHARKAFAGRWGVPMKIFKKRITAYPHPRRADTVRLWLGLSGKPSAAEHKSIARQLGLARNADRRALRRARLPIEQGAGAMLETAARHALESVYIPTLRRDYKRRIARRRARARARRR